MQPPPIYYPPETSWREASVFIWESCEFVSHQFLLAVITRYPFSVIPTDVVENLWTIVLHYTAFYTLVFQ